jgi:hypothetical protein
MNARTMIAIAVLVPFSLFSVMVTVEHGYFGFLELALREPWAMQMLLDLTITLVLFGVLAVPDARARGLRIWPWLAASVLVGSIAPLGYLVYRELAARTGTARATPHPAVSPS